MVENNLNFFFSLMTCETEFLISIKGTTLISMRPWNLFYIYIFIYLFIYVWWSETEFEWHEK